MDAKARPGEHKYKWNLLPYDAMNQIIAVFEYGANKYGDRDWEKGYKWSEFFNPIFRHLTAWWKGEDYDKESGMHHLAHAACTAIMLLTFVLRKSGEDDRPLPIEYDSKSET